MSTTRWTIRSVDDDVIHAVQALQIYSGASLGEIVSRALRHGIPATQTELLARQPIDLDYLRFVTKLT